METRPDVIAIVGPTASGKTALALEIAECYNAEIICADSRTIYAGMDIGTAKPTLQEQQRVRHWGLDIVKPNEQFSAADFQHYARRAIDDIHGRGKLVVIAGGTGLYVDSLLYNYSFGQKAESEQRAQLELLTIEELQNQCISRNIPLPSNDRNKRHLIRAIEREGSKTDSSTLLSSAKIVGIATSMATIRARIEERAEHLFTNDVAAEATMLGKKYGWNNEAMTGNIYPLLKEHLEGRRSLSETKRDFATADYRLAKRQMTWFRRNSDIMWCERTSAKDYIESLLVAE